MSLSRLRLPTPSPINQERGDALFKRVELQLDLNQRDQWKIGGAIANLTNEKQYEKKE
jgi:hypothetical protein